MSDLRVTREALAPAQSQLPGRQLLRPGTVRAREASACSRAARATSATSSRCPRSATTTPCRRKARAAPWCARRPACELVSNVCRHRQAVMLRGRGNTGSNIVCPLHRWTYDLQRRADRRAALRRRPLPATWPTTRCRPGTAWCSRPPTPRRDVAADLAGIGPRADLDFTGYVLDSVKLHECDYNWKTFIEVYLEDYHVAPFHPGPRPVRHLRGPALGVRRRTTRCRPSAPKNELAKPGSPAYRKWHDAVLAYRDGVADPCRHGAIWLTYYPAIDGRVVSARAGRLDARTRRARRRRSTSSSSTTPRRSPPSSASSSRPSRRPTGRPAPRTTRSPCAWTPAGAP